MELILKSIEKLLSIIIFKDIDEIDIKTLRKVIKTKHELSDLHNKILLTIKDFNDGNKLNLDLSMIITQFTSEDTINKLRESSEQLRSLHNKILKLRVDLKTKLQYSIDVLSTIERTHSNILSNIQDHPDCSCQQLQFKLDVITRLLS